MVPCAGMNGGPNLETVSAHADLRQDVAAITGNLPNVPLEQASIAFSDAAIIERLIRAPELIPDELVVASISRLLDNDINKIGESLSRMLASHRQGRNLEATMLKIFVMTWADVNGYRIVKESDAFRLADEVKERIREQAKHGRLKTAMRHLLGLDKKTLTETIHDSEAIAVELDDLKLQLARVSLELANANNKAADILNSAQSGADSIRRDARSEADKIITDAREQADRLVEQGYTTSLSLQTQADGLRSEISNLRALKDQVVAEAPLVQLTKMTADLQQQIFVGELYSQFLHLAALENPEHQCMLKLGFLHNANAVLDHLNLVEKQHSAEARAGLAAKLCQIGVSLFDAAKFRPDQPVTHLLDLRFSLMLLSKLQNPNVSVATIRTYVKEARSIIERARGTAAPKIEFLMAPNSDLADKVLEDIKSVLRGPELDDPAKVAEPILQDLRDLSELISGL